MKKLYHSKFYIDNRKYSDFLETQNKKSFEKYIDFAKRFIKKNDSFLDVGCGSGIVLSMISSKYKVYGIDISKTSINLCKNKKLNCLNYDGKKIPFDNNHFNLVGSFNVLEHTDSPINFLNENLRVLKKNGYLIIVCPNFLSITNNYHHRTKGINRKLLNLVILFNKIFKKQPSFEKMTPLFNKNFMPDDDAVNVSNPLDILKWAKLNNLLLIYWSSQQLYKKGLLINLLDTWPFKIFLGSCFFVFKKI